MARRETTRTPRAGEYRHAFQSPMERPFRGHLRPALKYPQGALLPLHEQNSTVLGPSTRKESVAWKGIVVQSKKS